ncbi:rpp14 protein family [Zymoseptoria brevis]|uniref:Ribonuclease P/MRP protein subunit POP5 n=1 Tax=Zymoseptoria brevis TaxID=1047168 RepID=A0A0F4GEP9_9PEZI|nr:rpp14 protein family [Zymoseptoria brevis]
MVRLKHRYLLVNILYTEPAKPARPAKTEAQLPWTVQFRRPGQDKLDGKLLAQLVRDGVAELFGDYGAGMVAGSLQVKYISSATNTAIIRVSRAHYRFAWAALTFTTKLPNPVNESCVIQVVRVSGTIKKAEEEAIRRARLGIVRARRAAEGKTGVADSLSDDEFDDLGMAGGIEDRDGDDDEDEDEDDGD